MRRSLAFVAVLAACRFPPNPAYQQLAARERAVEEIIRDERAKYRTDVATSPVPRLDAIATREGVQRSFDEATVFARQARECLATEFLDGESEGETPGGACTLLFDRAEAAARAPRLVISTWTKLTQTAPAREGELAAKVTTVQGDLAPALADGSELLATVATKAGAYPFKRPDLEARLAAVRALPGELAAKLALVSQQVAANAVGAGDVAELERAIAAMEGATARAQAAVPELRKRIGELADDEHTLLVRLEKTTVGPEQIFVATLRTIRNGVAQPDVAMPLDAATFTRYFIMAIGLQQQFPDSAAILERPAPALLVACAPRIVLTTNITVAQKEPGQYADETSRSPTPSALALGHVSDPAYGTWEPHPDGSTTWRFDAAWQARHAAPPQIDDVVFVRYSMWRFDTGFACGFDRAGNRVTGPGTCDETRIDALVDNVLAVCAPPPDPDPDNVVTIRGAGPHVRARGMGGGGK